MLWVQGGGRKDWYLARDETELETVLARIRPIGPYGYSDRIEVFATGVPDPSVTAMNTYV